MALRETCCFYANQSGVISENPAMVRESGKKKRHRSDNWSPRLTTLLSVLAGPLILI